MWLLEIGWMLINIVQFNFGFTWNNGMRNHKPYREELLHDPVDGG